MTDFRFLPDKTPKPETLHKRTLHGQKPPLKPRDGPFVPGSSSKESGAIWRCSTWLVQRPMNAGGYVFPSRVHNRGHLSTRQYARIVSHWIASIGLDPHKYGTHSIRRTKAALIYKKTGNLRAVQLLLGHTKLESTFRYLGIEVDDALRISEQTEL